MSGHEAELPTSDSSLEGPAALSGASETKAGAWPTTFLDLYEEQVDFVWRVARRLGVGEDDVDDFVQEVFVVVHRRLGEFERRSSIRTWIFGIVFHGVATYRRTRRRRREVVLAEPEATSHEDASPCSLAERAQKVALLHALLEKLDDDKRAAFVLSELEQMTAPEIAEATGTNLNTVYARIRAARRDFQIALDRHRESDRRRQP